MSQRDKSSKLIEFLPVKKSVDAGSQKNLLEAALSAGIELSHSCGGNGSCGTCLVRVHKGLSSLPPRNLIEAEMANDRRYLDHERLACQTPAHSALAVEIPCLDEAALALEEET